MSNELNLLQKVEQEEKDVMEYLAKELKARNIDKAKYDAVVKSKKASYASKKVRARKDMALNQVLAWVDKNCKVPEILNLSNSLKPGHRTVKVSAKSAVIALFNEKSKQNENDLFISLKLGRTEMKRYMTSLIKDAEPEDRMWISFDPDSGSYKLEAIGSEAPKGWTGFIPVTIKDLEITDDDVQAEPDEEAIVDDDDEVEVEVE